VIHLQSRRAVNSISPKSPQVGVQFVFTLVENRTSTRIDGEETFVISNSRRRSYGLRRDLGRVP
jgi:hypothetical protein